MDWGRRTKIIRVRHLFRRFWSRWFDPVPAMSSFLSLEMCWRLANQEKFHFRPIKKTFKLFIFNNIWIPNFGTFKDLSLALHAWRPSKWAYKHLCNLQMLTERSFQFRVGPKKIELLANPPLSFKCFFRCLVIFRFFVVFQKFGFDFSSRSSFWL